MVADGVTYPGRVILCDGGFERNAELVSRFLGGPMVAPCGPPQHMGDALLMGIELGAKLGNMAEAWWAPAHHVPGETIDGAEYFRPLFERPRRCPAPSSSTSTASASRNQAANYDSFGRSMLAWDPFNYRYHRSPSWMIFDATRAGENPNSIINPKNAVDWIISAQTIAELAEKIAVPVDALVHTVESYNTYAALGRDPEFHRGEYPRDQFIHKSANPVDHLKPLSEPPFYAVEALPGCLGTKGGLVIDEFARVVRVDGSVIDGLFAAGNTAANGFGLGYPGGGGTIGPAIVFGWVAGETAAR